MRDARGHEEQVAGRYALTFVAVDELASAACDDVNLVARVWLLRVRAARRVNLDDERAVLKSLGETLAARAGQQGERVRDCHSAARRGKGTAGFCVFVFLHLHKRELPLRDSLSEAERA